MADNINAVIGLFTTNAQIPVLNLLLPLGISFYTLQSVGYVVDVYRGKYEPDPNLPKFALFMSFFLRLCKAQLPDMIS